MRRRGSDWKDPDPIGRLMLHDFFRLRPTSPVGSALSSARRDEFGSHDSLDDATVRGLFTVRHEPGPTLVATPVRYHDDVGTVSRSAADIVVTTSSRADGVEVDVAAADGVEVIVRHCSAWESMLLTVMKTVGSHWLPLLSGAPVEARESRILQHVTGFVGAVCRWPDRYGKEPFLHQLSLFFWWRCWVRPGKSRILHQLSPRLRQSLATGN